MVTVLIQARGAQLSSAWPTMLRDVPVRGPDTTAGPGVLSERQRHKHWQSGNEDAPRRVLLRPRGGGSVWGTGIPLQSSSFFLWILVWRQTGKCSLRHNDKLSRWRTNAARQQAGSYTIVPGFESSFQQIWSSSCRSVCIWWPMSESIWPTSL